TLAYHLEDCPLVVIESRSAGWKGAGWNNCEMVTYLRIVKNALVMFEPVVIEHSLSERIVEFAQRRSHRRQVIFRQCARIRTRISDGFMSFVERLRDLQSALRGETEAAVRFALQACQ